MKTSDGKGLLQWQWMVRHPVAAMRGLGAAGHRIRAGSQGASSRYLQVKEKFGGLRFCVNHANDAILRRIEAAEQEPFLTCEVYGQPGKLQKVVGLRPCATSTPVHAAQETMAELSDEQIPAVCERIHKRS